MNNSNNEYNNSTCSYSENKSSESKTSNKSQQNKSSNKSQNAQGARNKAENGYEKPSDAKNE